MIVSNNNLLKILLPNESKVLKEALKEADIKTLTNIKKGDVSLEDIIKNLFAQAKTGAKGNSSIETLLKNSTIFKDLGNFTKTIDNLLKNSTNNETIQKYKPILESLIKNLTNIDDKALKSSIEKSGIFLESKMLSQSQSNTSLPKNLENILNQIKTILKQVDLPQGKNISQLIDKIMVQNQKGNESNNLETLKDLKNITQQLENLGKTLQNKQTVNLEQLTNNLKNISNQIQLTQSKIENSSTNQIQTLSQSKNEILIQTKEVLLNLKNEIAENKNIPNKQVLLNQIDNLLQSKDLFTKNLNLLGSKNILNNFHSGFSSNIETLINSIKSTTQQINTNNINQNSLQNISKSIDKLEQAIKNFSFNLNSDKAQNNNPIQNDIKAILLKVQEELVNKSDPKSIETSKQIERVITQIEYHQLLSLVSNSNNVYIPFIWDLLEDGSISMKEGKDEKFYCEINLNLKEFGDTKLLLGLYDKNKLDLTIYATKEHFKHAIKDNLYKLKRALNSVELIPVNIHILNFEKENKEDSKKTDVYNQGINIGFGVDIKV